jgi:hypothetical protein
MLIYINTQKEIIMRTIHNKFLFHCFFTLSALLTPHVLYPMQGLFEIPEIIHYIDKEAVETMLSHKDVPHLLKCLERKKFLSLNFDVNRNDSRDDDFTRIIFLMLDSKKKRIGGRTYQVGGFTHVYAPATPNKRGVAPEDRAFVYIKPVTSDDIAFVKDVAACKNWKTASAEYAAQHETPTEEPSIDRAMIKMALTKRNKTVSQVLNRPFTIETCAWMAKDPFVHLVFSALSKVAPRALPIHTTTGDFPIYQLDRRTTAQYTNEFSGIYRLCHILFKAHPEDEPFVREVASQLSIQ